MLEKFVQYFYLPKFRRLEHEIGCTLTFRDIPSRYINGLMRCEMTGTWKRAGLDIEKGTNNFTIGRVINGMSSRFDRGAAEYQSWLGGYTVKLATKTTWTMQDHFKLAIADQNSWLGRWYGDPEPMTTTEGWDLVPLGKVQSGRYSGDLYEFGCTTHSDVGRGYNTMKLRLASLWMAALFDLSNPGSKLDGAALRPRTAGASYETVKLRGYIAVFDVAENVKVVLYGNGVAGDGTSAETFAVLKDDLLKAMRSCVIETA